MDETAIKDLCAAILNYYQEAKDATAADITNLKISKARIYALSAIYKFTYRNTVYYVNDDYSLDDDVQLLQNILEDANHLLHGGAVENPHTQSDGARYAGGLNGKEYYLWKS